MDRKKLLWNRLQRLEEDYRTLIETDPVAPYAPLLHDRPSFDSRSLPRATDRVDRLQKEINALRARFGIPPEFRTCCPPSIPRVFVHRLPPGKMHPVSPQEVHATLAMLPSEDLRGLWRVVLTDSRKDRLASYGSCQIKLCYPVDLLYRVRLRRYEGAKEVRRFGAWVEEENGVRYVRWRPEDLKNYVLRHLLLHEVGHHVALLQGFGCGVVATRNEEAFAESYAYAYYHPETAVSSAIVSTAVVVVRQSPPTAEGEESNAPESNWTIGPSARHPSARYPSAKPGERQPR